jgi:hypothetical protein
MVQSNGTMASGVSAGIQGILPVAIEAEASQDSHDEPPEVTLRRVVREKLQRA